MTTRTRPAPDSRTRPGGPVGQRIAGSRRRLRRSVALTVVLYAATITALTLLPGWLMAR